MKKIRLEILGLSFSQTQSGAYALVLGETTGKRRLPIIIGGYEAQAIAVELENMTPSRPLTHDLFKNFAQAFEVTIQEVIVYNLKEGIFYSKLICSNGEKVEEIDARTSDAIAMAVRFSCPIYTYEFILAQAGIILEDEGGGTGKSQEEPKETAKTKSESSRSKTKDLDIANQTIEELKESLMRAIDEEAYETASKIRDEINRRKKQ
jgi:hypothetical protein